MTEIRVIKFKGIDLEGATIINGFPSMGLVNTIVANYIISSLELDQVGAFDSDSFPPISMVYDNKPKFPVRLYGDSQLKIAVVLAEFTPPPFLARPIARTLLQWAIDKKCRQIVSMDILSSVYSFKEGHIMAVGSTDSTREKFRSLGLEKFDMGIVGGIGGVLLNEARLKDFDVYSFLVQGASGKSSTLIAIDIMEILLQMMPHLKIDLAPLVKEAEFMEQYVTSIHKQAEEASKSKGLFNDSMYI